MNHTLIHILLFAGILLYSIYPVKADNKTHYLKVEQTFNNFQENTGRKVFNVLRCDVKLASDTIRLKDTIEINFPFHASNVLTLPSFIEMQAGKESIISFYIKNISNDTVCIYASSNTGGLAPGNYKNKLLPNEVILLEYIYAPRPGRLDKLVTLRWKTKKNSSYYENEIISIKLKGYRQLK